MSGPAARVLIATPTYTGQLYAEYVKSLTAAWVYCLYHKVELELNVADGYSLVQFARNRLAQDFLDDPSYTHILWLDSDLGFDPRAIMQLLAHDKDVVGGAYPVKSFPPWFPVEVEKEEDDPKALRRCSVLPTGFLLVSRGAMEAVAETVPYYTHHHQGQKLVTRHIFDLELVDRGGEHKDLIGEDVVLCHRLRELGFDLWLDPDIGFAHCGNHRWTGHLSKSIELEREKPTETPKGWNLRQSIGKAIGKSSAA